MDYTKIKMKMEEYLSVLEKLLDKNRVPSIGEVLDIDKKIKSVGRVAIEDDSILEEYDKSVNANELLNYNRPSRSRISSDLIIENDSDILNRRAKLATMKIYLTSFKEEIELRESIDEKSTKLEKKRTKEEIAEGSSNIVEQSTFDISPEKYIDLKVLPNDFYIELQEQINRAFVYNVLSAVQILSRKILENLIIDILRKKYKGPGIELYYNTTKRRFQGFEILLKNLSDKLDAGDFKGISDAFDRDLLRRVNEFREQGNSSAHSIELDLRREDIKQKGEEISFLIKVLLKVFENC